MHQQQELQQEVQQEVHQEMQQAASEPADPVQTWAEASEAVHASASKLEADMADASNFARDWEVSKHSNAIRSMGRSGAAQAKEAEAPHVLVASTVRGADVLERWSAARANAAESDQRAAESDQKEEQMRQMREQTRDEVRREMQAAAEPVDPVQTGAEASEAAVHASASKLEADMADASSFARDWQASQHIDAIRSMGRAVSAQAKEAEAPHVLVASTVRGADVLERWSASRAKAAESDQREEQMRQMREQTREEVRREMQAASEAVPASASTSQAAGHLSGRSLEGDVADVHVAMQEWKDAKFSSAIHGMAGDDARGAARAAETPRTPGHVFKYM